MTRGCPSGQEGTSPEHKVSPLLPASIDPVLLVEKQEQNRSKTGVLEEKPRTNTQPQGRGPKGARQDKCPAGTAPGEGRAAPHPGVPAGAPLVPCRGPALRNSLSTNTRNRSEGFVQSSMEGKQPCS